MQSLQQNFEELRRRLKEKKGINYESDDPVYYLVFSPEEMLPVKRHMKQFKAKLTLDGWQVHVFSMAEAVQSILSDSDFRDIWLESEADDPFDYDSINRTIEEALTQGDALKSMLENELQALSSENNAIFLITDIEALHPYLRVGSLEQKLQGKFTVPTVILYPGVRTGRTALSFLGIYPEDGNYRSVHIGG